MTVGPVPISPMGRDAPSCMVSPSSLGARYSSGAILYWLRQRRATGVARPQHLLRRRGLRRRLQVVRVAQMDRRVGFPRALEVEALGDLTDRREDLLTHQADAGERIGLADEAVVAPQRQDARPRLLEDALELLHHLVGRAVDDAQVIDLLFEGRAAARIDGTAGRELDESAAVGGRAVARGRAPHRMGKA